MMDIGTKKGTMLLFGGVYSNLQALEQLIDISKRLGIPAENCICTGDLVAYCAQPEEVVNTFRQWGALTISGNVEQQLANDEEDCGCDFKEGGRCDGLSKQWYPYAKGRLSKESIVWMAQLPEQIVFEYGGKKATVVHGSDKYVSDFIFESTPNDIKESCLKATESELIIAGHSGLPFSQKLSGGNWLNPGVIGMPANDGTTRVWYMLLKWVNNAITHEHHSFEYDFKTTQKLMLKNHLPKAYADTLSSGIWDNMEILPELEKMGQGIPLKLNIKADKSTIKKENHMSKSYYDPADLRKFGKITEWSEDLGKKFFDYYGKVFEEGALSAREKSLIALAVSHVVKCPYCIDAYTKDGLQRGITKEEMMESVHVGAAIESGATLVHGVQMMNKYNKLSM